jgi:hypothetical protein
VSARRVTAMAAVSGLAALVAGCGVPQSSGFEPIERPIQFELDQTTTTTTSSTVPVTVDATSTTVLETTSTISTEDVVIYFVAGSQISSVTIALTSPATPSQVLAKLLEGPPSGDIGTGLRSTIPPGSLITVTRASGVGVIDLPADIFDQMPGRDQRLFFAQLVLTIGRLGGIGPVQFTRAGAPASVIRGDGTTTEPGDAVTVDDYAMLLTGGAPIEVAPAPAATVGPVPPADTGTGTTVSGG